MAREEPDVVVFRHRMPWYGWLWAIGGLAGAVGLAVLFAPALEPSPDDAVGPGDMALRIALLVTFLWFTLLWPVWTLLHLLVWRVVIGGQGIVWSDRWVGHGSVRWTHVMAVGEPQMTRLPFRRMWQAYWLIQVRIITDRGRVDLYTEMFPRQGRGLYEAVAERAGLSDTIVLSGREFRCRPGWSPEQFWRQVAHGR